MEAAIKEFDVSCAICLLSICQPVELPCHHVFCLYCIEKLKENDPNDFNCPLCRALIPFQYKLTISKPIEQEYINFFKEIYDKRLKEIENLRMEDRFFEKIRLFYGNTHVKIENLEINKKNTHNWTFFIRNEPKSKYKLKDIIKKVEVELDPSFGGVPLIIRGEPFELSRKGYAEFTLVFKIFWQKWLKAEPCTLEHHLNFQKDILKKIHIIKFNRELIKNMISNKI